MDRWITVPAGEYTIGADKSNEPRRHGSVEPPLTLREPETEETPMRRVVLSAFEIGERAVSVSEWMRFVSSTKYNWSLIRRQLEYVLNRDPADAVRFVSWNDACAYIDWRNSLENESFSLPTECQWEAACRGPQALNFPWDISEADMERLFYNAFLVKGSKEYVAGDNAPVSRMGCEGLCLDVWEWCLDWHGNDLESLQEGARDPVGTVSGSLATCKGGGPSPNFPRCSARCSAKLDTRDYWLGFRLCRPGAVIDAST